MSPAAEARRHRRALVAEDDRTVRLVLTSTLRAGGYDVTALEDGSQLRAALREDAAPRLVVTDWDMPGASGVEICREIRERTDGDQFYVVVVTAKTSEQHLLEALRAGADDFIRKPFSPSELLARVQAGARVLDMQERLASKVSELGTALAEVRTLRGLIPICMHCHRIRTGPDDWQRLEAYLEEHSEALLSHSLCQECLQKFYASDVRAPQG